MRGTLNDDHFQKGQQVDEWLRQASKGESKMDYTNMDARSTGMFWAMSYMTGQSACDTVISWLTSGGTELLSASNLQSSDRIMVIREVNPVPISLLSGLSIHMCLKLSSQLEETMFSGQLNPFQEEQMFSACIAGRRFLILNFLKDPKKEEDDHIIELIQRYGSRKWSVIAKYLPGRIGKQCRKSVIPLTNTKKIAKQSRWRSEFKENVKIRSKIEELDFVI